MRRFSKILVLLTVTAGLAVPAALAAPHFIANQPNSGDPQCTWDGSSNSITCSFKIAGLGNVSSVSATVQVSRICTTQSGSNSPPGQLKSRPAPLAVSNGQTTQSPVTFTFSKLLCPGSQTTTIGNTVEFFVGKTDLGAVPLTTT